MPQSLFMLWPAATNVVALRPHQTKRKPTAVPSWITQPPRNIFKQRKGRHGVKFNFDLHLQTASALFENANAFDGTSCTAKASLTSMSGLTLFSSTASSSELNLPLLTSIYRHVYAPLRVIS